MIEKLLKQLSAIETTPPWICQTRDRKLGAIVEGFGAPEPGEYEAWQKQITMLRTQIVEEEARQMIDRP